MSEAQRFKHIADRMPQQLTRLSSLDAAEPTPDGLGTWEGGPLALKGANTWVNQKSHPTQTADTKNAPGTDYASKMTPEVAPLKIEESDNIPCDAEPAEPTAEDYKAAVEDYGDDVAKAVASEPATA